MTSLLDSLEAKARAATQSGRTERGSEVYNARAALIAACSPETILKLIAVARAAKDVLAEAIGSHETARPWNALRLSLALAALKEKL